VVAGVPVLRQAEINGLYVSIKTVFLTVFLDNNRDHLPSGGWSSPTSSASVLPSLVSLVVILGELVTGVPPSKVPCVASDTSMPPVVEVSS
jgi:hypothetical protein